MAWLKKLFERLKNKSEQTVIEPKEHTPVIEPDNHADIQAVSEPDNQVDVQAVSVPAEDQTEKYTYRVGGLSKTDPWIFILCNEEDALWEPETFTYFLKKAAGWMNGGVWEGNILPAGHFQGDSRFRIKTDPLFLVYQYDTLFGIVVEYPPRFGVDEILNYLENALDVEVDDQFRKH